MIELKQSHGTSRLRPISRSEASARVLTELDKSSHAQGMGYSFKRTIAWLPELALHEVDYRNSFTIDEKYFRLRDDASDSPRNAFFPSAGFIDHTTKELAINLVCLLDRCRYSIIHHTVLGFHKLCESHSIGKAEYMLLQLVDNNGNTAFEGRNDLYSAFQLATLRMAVMLRKDVRCLSDAAYEEFRLLCHVEARRRMQGYDVNKHETDSSIVSAYVNGMIVELTWCINYSTGLLNKWLTLMRVKEETESMEDKINFAAIYNEVVPESVKERNNCLLGNDGWGNM
jgi:hypothetical protein